jgi:epoxyqueuosine reductase QueG
MNAALRLAIEEDCRRLEVPLVGFAPVDRWDEPRFEPWVPVPFRPASIVPGMRTVIVIGMPVFLPAVETAPSIWYHELYRTVNELLDANAYHIASSLNMRGHASVSVPRDGYGSVRVLLERPVAFFSHRHAAYLAGLGTFGVNNALLTPAYGPRVRFTSIFTSAELPSDPVIETDLCTHCMRCVKFCPAGALKAGDYPGSLTDKRACAEQSVALAARHISPCGRCIAVCPVGEDRRLFTREAVGYRDYEDDNYNDLHRGWEHVRSYGGD